VKARRWVGILICCFNSASAFGADETTVQTAVEAVHGWYHTLGDGSDQEHLKEFGAVGRGVGPLAQAHGQLAADLQKHMDRDQFFVHFRGLARMRLLQAHGVTSTANENYVQVFVEEERTMAIEGIPAVAWFQGFLSVTKTPDSWKISSLDDVKPENIISTLDDPVTKRGDPVEVALTRLQCGSPEDCSVLKKTLPPNSSDRLGRVTIQTPRGMGTVGLARLHNGQWTPVDIETETGSAPK
jgi:hypothetical protein